MNQTHPDPPHRKRQLVFGLIMLVAVAGVTVLVAEIALRLLPVPGIEYHSFRFNELTGGSFYPNSQIIYRNARGDHTRRRVNDWGFLDKPHDLAKPEGTLRIGFFGDSYTEAKQVPLEQTFFRLTEQRLNENASVREKYECLAFGLSGYGTLQSYLECGEWMEKTDLDWVVYVFVENDPGDQIREVKRSDAIPSAYIAETGEFAIDDSFRQRYAYKNSTLHRAQQFIKSHSLLVSTIKARLKLLKERGIKMHATEADMQMTEAAPKQGPPNQNVPPSQWPDSLRTYAEDLGALILTRWAEEVRASGRRFVVVYVPRESEIDTPYDEQDSWVEWLTSVCEANDIALVDPSPHLVAARDAGAEIYYDHFTPAGHEAMMTAIVEHVQQIIILRTGVLPRPQSLQPPPQAELGRPADIAPPPEPHPIKSPAGEGGREPNLFADNDGRIILNWTETDDDGARLRFATFADGRWTKPTRVAQGRDWFVNWADFPSVIRSGGVLVAHWLQKSAPTTYAYDVRLSRSFDRGRSWTSPQKPHTDGTTTEHGFVSMLPWENESVLLVWLDGRETALPADPDGEDAAPTGSTGGGADETNGGADETGGGADETNGGADEMNGGGHKTSGGIRGDHPGRAAMTLRGALQARDGSLSHEALLDDRVCDCCNTSGALTSSGAVFVYRDRGEDEVRDVGSVRFSSTGWQTSQTIHDDGWEIAGCPVNGPAVASVGSRVAVAWYTGARNIPRVMLAFSDNGGTTFSMPTRIDDGAALGRTDVVMLGDGTALVTWMEATKNGAVVVSRYVKRDGSMSPSRRLAVTSSSRQAGFPRMVRSGDQVMVSWTRPGTPSTIETVLLDVSGHR